jgi:hypothetical protein
MGFPGNESIGRQNTEYHSAIVKEGEAGDRQSTDTLLVDTPRNQESKIAEYQTAGANMECFSTEYPYARSSQQCDHHGRLEEDRRTTQGDKPTQDHKWGGVYCQMLNTAVQEWPEYQPPQTVYVPRIDSKNVESMIQGRIDDLNAPENSGKGEDIDCSIRPGTPILTGHLQAADAVFHFTQSWNGIMVDYEKDCLARHRLLYPGIRNHFISVAYETERYSQTMS